MTGGRKSSFKRSEVLLFGGILALLPTLGAGSARAADSGSSGAPDPAFQSILRQNSPMTPEEIRKYRHFMLDKQKATFDTRPPRLRRVQDVVHLGAGVIPPVVRLSPGYSGVLVVTDVTGAPWPITHHKVASSRFLVEHPKNKAGNALIVTPQGDYGSTDLLIFLSGLATPVAVRLVNDPRSMDLSTRLIVPRGGPNAYPPQVGPAEKAVVTDEEERFLAGIPPPGAKRLRTSKDLVSAWAFRGRYYIRTRDVLASPAHLSLAHGEDGTALYEVAPVPVLIVDHEGQSLRVTLSDEETADGR